MTNLVRTARHAAAMVVPVAALALAIGGCSHPGDGGAARDAGQLSDGSSGDDWPAFGRTYGEQHYSPLAEVNAGTVKRLGLAWTLDMGPGNSVTGPIEVGGTLYFANAYSHVHAVDVATGKELWDYDPGAAEAAGRRLRQGWGSRGLAWWDGKVYTGTQDGRLIAIDAKTGKPVWSVMTLEKGDYRFISGAPRVFDGKIVIGHGGADAANVRGYVTAYDAATGKQLWRFYTVPGNPADGFENDAMRMAAKTWAGQWWKYGGGGTVWNAITYDQALDQIYIGTGNGAPWNYNVRSAGKGDNLFLSSIVALDAKTGAYKWHYQTNPAESWDYNASMDMQLADVKIAGQDRQVLMTAPKNGFLYVLDRTNGKLVSAKPYVPVTWATGIDPKSGRPIEAPGLRDTSKPFEMAPGTFGAHTWLPMAYSPKTALVYIPTIELSTTFDQFGAKPGEWKRAGNNILDVAEIATFPLDSKGASSLVAIDPLSQKQRWRIPTPGYMNGGVMATGGGLVFQGQIDGSFNAYAAADGRKLWSFDARSPVIAPPITYRVGGRQYVTVLTGMGTAGAYLGPLLERFGINPATQARRVLTFVLDGKAPLPPTEAGPVVIPADPDYRPDPAAEQRGLMLFAQRCSVCHGFRAVGVGAAPDLRGSSVPRSADAFDSVLKDGVLAAGGMPQFDELSEQERADIRQYIRSEAVKARARRK